MSDQCPTCGGEMDIHYGEWCPMCDKPEDEHYRVLDFFRVSRYIAAHEGYVGTTDDWTYDLLQSIEIPGNDCYISWYDDETTVLVIRQFHEGLAKYFDVKPGDRILLNISW